MNNIRKERTKQLYIDITCEMIRTQGVNAVTIRSISEKAGYNSATLYSYFSNLSELIFFAHMRFEDELLELFKQKLDKEQPTKLYNVWHKMYTVMFGYFMDNPNIFDCIMVNDYDTDNIDVKKRREKTSDFECFVTEKLKQIAAETNKNFTLINGINLVCLAQINGAALLLQKNRISTDVPDTVSVMESNLKKIIACFMEENSNE